MLHFYYNFYYCDLSDSDSYGYDLLLSIIFLNFLTVPQLIPVTKLTGNIHDNSHTLIIYHLHSVGMAVMKAN